MKVQTKVGSLLGERYRIKGVIGSGAFGKIFKAYDTKDADTEVAVKVSTFQDPVEVTPPPLLQEAEACVNKLCPYLETEFWVLKNLEGYLGFPKALELDVYKGDSYLAMNLLGRSLYDELRERDFSFTIVDTLLLVDQLLTRLQTMHDAGIVHGDISPNNMVMGTGKKAGTVYLIDFGLAKMCGGGNQQSNQHAGPLLNNSRNISDRRDDLEELAYVIALFLRYKNLTELQGSDPSIQCRMGMKGEHIFHKCPREFVRFFDSIQKLEVNERPRYEEYRKMFRRLGRASGIKYGHDWPFWP